VNPDVVVRDEEGRVMSVRYEAVNAMLLNEFLKEHKKVEEQDAMIMQMEKQIATFATALARAERIEVSKDGDSR
jgi:hypothetical protein